MRLLKVLTCLLLLAACGDNKPQREELPLNQATVTTENSRPDFNAGDLIDRINCAGDATLSFALYLPSNYKSTDKLPVLILFDPQGDAQLPLEKYRKLADAYGYLLMASNDSKNGNDAALTGRILDAMVRSARIIVNADSARIYAAGFSGGARVAGLLGLSPAGVQGFAVCGAGFPAAQWYSIPPTIAVALAGNADMNLNEMLKIQPRDEFSGRFQLIRYNGKHEWPPEEIFEMVFMAFESYAMRDKLRPADQKILQHIDSRFRQQAAQLNVSGRLIESKLLYEAWIKNLEKQYAIDDVLKSYKDITSRPQYRMNSNNEAQVMKEEEQLRNQYVQSLGTKDTGWWNTSMTALHTEIKTSRDRQRSDMLQRVQGYTSLAVYSALGQSMRNMQQVKLLDYLTAVYRITDPANPEAWYLSAVIAAANMDNHNALRYLEISVKNGFSDLKRMQTETAFSRISADADFNRLQNQVRQKAGGS